MKILKITLVLFLRGIIGCFAQTITQLYHCKPCDLSCDSLSFQQPGECPHCQMPLMADQELQRKANLKINDVKIGPGSGEFLLEGGKGHKEKTIRVYYHKPQKITPNSPIHADQNVMLVYYICKSIAGELAALNSNEYAFDMVTTLYFALSYKYFAAAMLIFWELWPV